MVQQAHRVNYLIFMKEQQMAIFKRDVITLASRQCYQKGASQNNKIKQQCHGCYQATQKIEKSKVDSQSKMYGIHSTRASAQSRLKSTSIIFNMIDKVLFCQIELLKKGLKNIKLAATASKIKNFQKCIRRACLQKSFKAMNNCQCRLVKQFKTQQNQNSKFMLIAPTNRSKKIKPTSIPTLLSSFNKKSKKYPTSPNRVLTNSVLTNIVNKGKQILETKQFALSRKKQLKSKSRNKQAET